MNPPGGIQQWDSFLASTKPTAKAGDATSTFLFSDECPDLIVLEARMRGLKEGRKAKWKGIQKSEVRTIEMKTQEEYLLAQGFDKVGNKIPKVKTKSDDRHNDLLAHAHNKKQKFDYQHDETICPKVKTGDQIGKRRESQSHRTHTIDEKPLITSIDKNKSRNKKHGKH